MNKFNNNNYKHYLINFQLIRKIIINNQNKNKKRLNNYKII